MMVGHWFLWILIVFLTLIHIRGQSEPIPSKIGEDESQLSASETYDGALSDSSTSDGLGDSRDSYPDPRRKRYQSASLLVRPLWLNPKHTWKAFQMNQSRNEKKDEENRKLRDRKRTKARKLMEKLKKAAILSKKLFLILNEIDSNLASDSA